VKAIGTQINRGNGFRQFSEEHGTPWNGYRTWNAVLAD